MYCDKEELIIDFYLCSLKNDWQEFDWDEAFIEFAGGIQEKLAEHGLTGYEDFRNREEDYGFVDKNILEPFSVCSHYVYFPVDDVFEAIMKAKYEAFQNAFGSMFSDLQEYLDQIQNIGCFSLQEKITLFDNIIHAQHVNGNIFDDLNTEELKEAAEEMYKTETENY